MSSTPKQFKAIFDDRIEKKTPDGSIVKFSFLNKKFDTIKSTKQIITEIVNDYNDLKVLSSDS